jgi:hypothetical protein
MHVSSLKNSLNMINGNLANPCMVFFQQHYALRYRQEIENNYGRGGGIYLPKRVREDYSGHNHIFLSNYSSKQNNH